MLHELFDSSKSWGKNICVSDTYTNQNPYRKILTFLQFMKPVEHVIRHLRVFLSLALKHTCFWR